MTDIEQRRLAPIVIGALDFVCSRISDGMWRELGPDWGPYATDTWAQLALHVMDELAHHGAEVALLRDLYLRRDAS